MDIKIESVSLRIYNHANIEKKRKFVYQNKDLELFLLVLNFFFITFDLSMLRNVRFTSWIRKHGTMFWRI